MQLQQTVPDCIVADFFDLPNLREESIKRCYEDYYTWLNRTFTWLQNAQLIGEECDDIKYLFIQVCQHWGNHFDSTINLYFLEKLGVI